MSRLSPHHCCSADGTSSLSYPIARGAVPDSGVAAWELHEGKGFEESQREADVM